MAKKYSWVTKPPKFFIGWQEWCSLPNFHIPAIKAKIDTGAKTSSLHASNIRTFHRHGDLFVHFTIQPLQQTSRFETHCTALVVDKRPVTTSGGHKEIRYVITTLLTLGHTSWNIELTLTNRASMTFRMLLGRDAIKDHAIIDPGKILYQGKLDPKQIRSLYIQARKGSLH